MGYPIVHLLVDLHGRVQIHPRTGQDFIVSAEFLVEHINLDAEMLLVHLAQGIQNPVQIQTWGKVKSNELSFFGSKQNLTQDCKLHTASRQSLGRVLGCWLTGGGVVVVQLALFKT